MLLFAFNKMHCFWKASNTVLAYFLNLACLNPVALSFINEDFLAIWSIYPIILAFKNRFALYYIDWVLTISIWPYVACNFQAVKAYFWIYFVHIWWRNQSAVSVSLCSIKRFLHFMNDFLILILSNVGKVDLKIWRMLLSIRTFSFKDFQTNLL